VELRTPVRLSWDLFPRPGAEIPYEGIAADVAAARFLALDLSERGEDLSPCRLILDRLGTPPLAVTLTLSCSVLRAACCGSGGIPDFLFAPPVRLLLVEDCSPEDFPFVREVRRAAGGRVPVGVSFPVRRDSWEALPDVVRFCAGEEGAHLAIPMTRVVAGEECLVLSPAEQRRLGEALVASPRPEPRRLSVHDPFLWRLLHPGLPFPEGICQAANTMLHIAADATVYPCPLVPTPLGSLREARLGEIIASPAKREVRAKILALPGVCRECGMLELEGCRGGCRGRGYTLTGSWDAADPGCGKGLHHTDASGDRHP
jgi:GeoRSP system SPASM domain protein